MADAKVSALTALGAAPASNDLIPMVDVSDTTMAASGTTKSMTQANLEGGLSLANQTGTVAPTHGGTGAATYALGDTLYSDASNSLAKLSGNTTATKKFLRQTGTGSVSAAPAWDTIVAGDVPTLNQNTSGSAASFTGNLAGDVTGGQSATTVGKINGTSLGGLATGILKNTTTTGVPSIAVAGDFPTLNQDTTGKSAKTDALNSATTVVNVAAATAPSANQVLTAVDSTHATWQTPAAGGGQTLVTKVVAASGGDYTTLGAALAAASDGWTIYIKPGSTYTESAITDTHNNITIVSDGPESAVIAMGANNATFSGNLVTIRGIKITVDAGIWSLNGTNSEMVGCHIVKSVGSANSAISLGGADSLFSGNYFLSNVAATTSSQIAIGGSRARVAGNTISCASGFNNFISVSAQHCTVTGNTFLATGTNTGATTMLQGSGGYITVSSNVFQSPATANHQTSGFKDLGGDSQIIGNIFRNLYFAVTNDGTTIANITGNTISSGQTGAGGGINAVGNYNITGNHFQGVAGATAVLINASAAGVVVSGNQIINWGTGISVASSVTRFAITGNSLGGNTTDISVSSNSGNILDNTPFDITKQVRTQFMKNTSGGTLAAGDVVVYAPTNGDEVTTTTTGGDNRVFGAAVGAPANNAYGYFIVEGKGTISVDGTGTAIAVGDLLSCQTTVKKAVKAVAGDTVIARALAATSLSTTINALFIRPFKI